MKRTKTFQKLYNIFTQYKGQYITGRSVAKMLDVWILQKNHKAVIRFFEEKGWIKRMYATTPIGGTMLVIYVSPDFGTENQETLSQTEENQQ